MNKTDLFKEQETLKAAIHKENARLFSKGKVDSLKCRMLYRKLHVCHRKLEFLEGSHE